MHINKGVEWAVHACTVLAVTPKDKGLSAEILARYHDVPPAYMAKQLQLLSKSGIVASTRGAKGGYFLKKDPADISLWDITAAIEGTAPAFRCTEIRQNGPCKSKPEECTRPCPINASFLAAEKAYREVLASKSLLSILQGIAEDSTPDHLVDVANWMEKETG